MSGEQLAVEQLTELLPVGPEGDAAIQAAIDTASAKGGASGRQAAPVHSEPPAASADGVIEQPAVAAPHNDEAMAVSAAEGPAVPGSVATADGFDVSVDAVIDGVAAVDGVYAADEILDQRTNAASAGLPDPLLCRTDKCKA